MGTPFRLRQRLGEQMAGNPASHPVWRDAEAARLCTERLIRIARRTGKRIHVLHVSTADEMPLLEFGDVKVTKLAGNTWRVTAEMKNTKAIPTRIEAADIEELLDEA